MVLTHTDIVRYVTHCVHGCYAACIYVHKGFHTALNKIYTGVCGQGDSEAQSLPRPPSIRERGEIVVFPTTTLVVTARLGMKKEIETWQLGLKRLGCLNSVIAGHFIHSRPPSRPWHSLPMSIPRHCQQKIQHGVAIQGPIRGPSSFSDVVAIAMLELRPPVEY